LKKEIFLISLFMGHVALPGFASIDPTEPVAEFLYNLWGLGTE
jgi:hypothetical protein